MAQVDPDQDAALRRLRAAFGFVEVLAIIDHEPDQDATRDQQPKGGQGGEPEPPTDSG
jgi:hypothetical protein